MEVQLTPDQQAFVRQAIQSGRLRREEDALKEELTLWEDRERTRAEILAAVDEQKSLLPEVRDVSSRKNRCASLPSK